VPKTITPPMTEKDYTDCNAALRDILRVIDELETALRGGAPCADQINGLKELQAMYEKWKSAYFPDRP
jgi:hypothetical protein